MITQVPIGVGMLALLMIVILLFLERKKDLTERSVEYVSRLGLSYESSARLFSTFKGFLLIVLLAFVVAAFLYYFQ